MLFWAVYSVTTKPTRTEGDTDILQSLSREVASFQSTSAIQELSLAEKRSGTFGSPVHHSLLCFANLLPSTGRLFHAPGSNVKLGFSAPRCLSMWRAICGALAAAAGSIPQDFSGAFPLSPLAVPQRFKDFLGRLSCSSAPGSALEAVLTCQGGYLEKRALSICVCSSEIEILAQQGRGGSFWGEQRLQNCRASSAVHGCSSFDEMSDLKSFWKNRPTSCCRRWQISHIFQ